MTVPRRHIEGVHCLDDVLSNFPGGGTPLYGLYRYLRPQRVAVLVINRVSVLAILVINRVSIFVY